MLYRAVYISKFCGGGTLYIFGKHYKDVFLFLLLPLLPLLINKYCRKNICIGEKKKKRLASHWKKIIVKKTFTPTPPTFFFLSMVHLLADFLMDLKYLYDHPPPSPIEI